MLERKSDPLWFKLYLDPITIILVLFGWDWSLLTVNQSVIFSRSEFKLSAIFAVSCDDVKICVSSAYKQGIVDFKQFGKSFI